MLTAHQIKCHSVAVSGTLAPSLVDIYSSADGHPYRKSTQYWGSQAICTIYDIQRSGSRHLEIIYSLRL